MKPITYLCFTLLSILIQFCLMDFINERFQNDTSSIDYNSRKSVRNLYVKEKPHALFYRTEAQKIHMDSTEKYSNSSLPITKFASSTDQTSTVFDLVYDENTSMTDITLTTETYFTNSDLDNVTDITFFDKKNINESTSAIAKKDISRKNCYCDLQYKNCDINCCCDSDCSDKEKELFRSCEAGYQRHDNNCKDISPSKYLCSTDTSMPSDIFHYLFCIKKINLPDNRKISQNRLSTIDVNKYLKWHNNMKDKPLDKFTKNLYGPGSPVWFLKNGTLNVISYPVTVTNQYCSGEEPMKYLINTHVKCFVKIEELHMLQVLKLFLDAKAVSPVEKTINSTLLDCTALHCTNWTVHICNAFDCNKYNKELHNPYCSDDQCYNIGTKVQYVFHSNTTTIIEATVKIYVKNILPHQFVKQEILVDYFMGNESTKDVIQFSGNPGYINGFPVIASYMKSNHTHYFYNRTHNKMNFLVLPYNENGECVLQNMKQNIVKFNQNKRINCRLALEQNIVTFNKTDGCLKIQARLLELLKLNNSVYISPFGNPTDIKDEKWLSMERFNENNIYGESGLNNKFVCRNLVTRFAFVIIFGTENVNNVEQNIILKATVEGAARNVTFSVDQLSTMVTVDTSFIDASAPPTLEYAAPPHFTFRLPNNFFLPPDH